MKVLLAILALLAICSAVPLAPQADIPPIAYTKGFLAGIHETKSIDDLLKCLSNMDPIFEKLKQAMEHFMKFTLDEIMVGLKLLKEAMYDCKEMFGPCFEGFEQLKKLEEAMKNWDIVKIATKILTNAIPFIRDIKECISGFQTGDYFLAGKATGDIQYRIFLERDEDGVDIAAFLKGFLEGINESGDINELLKCAKNLESVIKKILEAFELIKNKTIESIIAGVAILIQAVKELLTILRPCSESFGQIKKLIEALKNISITKIAMKIFTNFSTFLKLITEFIVNINGDSHKAGKAFGEILYKLFLSREEVN